MYCGSSGILLNAMYYVTWKMFKELYSKLIYNLSNLIGGL